jgi:uncharacterized membrane protein YeiH
MAASAPSMPNRNVLAISTASKSFPEPYLMLVHTLTASLQNFFLAHVPRVRQADIYAMAALLGAVILIVIRRLGISATLAAIAGGVCCFVLRVVAG